MRSFFDFYELLQSSFDLTEKYVKDPEGKVCRFCLKSYPDVSFANLPHIVPELFGRNSSSSNFECDECNSKFQKNESDVSTMIQHYLAMTGVKSKKGVPNFQSQKDTDSYSTRAKRTDRHLNLNFGNNLDDFKFDEDAKTLAVFFRTKKFRPFSVYKILLKIGISLLPEEELNINNHFRDFLNAVEPIRNGMQIYTASRYMLRTGYVQIPNAQLYKAKETLIGNTVYPEYVIVINFANIILQMCLPIAFKNHSIHDPSQNLVFEMFPSFAREDIRRLSKIEMFQFEMDDTRKVSITDKIILHYDRLDKDV